MNKAVMAVALAALAGCAGTKQGTTAGAEKPAPLPEALPVRPLKTPAPMQMVALRTDQPIVSFRLVFRAGSVDDPVGKEGLTSLTSRVMAEGGTRKLSSAELLQVLFPMAAELSAHTDKELTVLEGRVHKDFLDRFLDVLMDVLLEPRFDPREFERLRSDALNAIRTGLRGEDDEQLGKVALDAVLYRGHPYGSYVGGTVKGLLAINLDDVKTQARRLFTQDRLVIGLAGPVDEALENKVKARLSQLPKSGAPLPVLPAAPGVHRRTLILAKDSLSTAISMGYAVSLRRGDPDFFPVAFALSYLGEHRQLTGVLFGELREKRGLNYGDYAYPEHFVQEGEATYSETNIARSEQDFSLWLRPVEPQNALFAAHGAVYFLSQLLEHGFDPDRFETVRGFLMGYTRLWEQTDERRLGYAIDDLFYGTSHFLDRYRDALAHLTPEQALAAARRQLDPSQLNLVFVTQDARALADALATGKAPSIQYATPKPPEVLETDKAIARQKLPADPASITVLDAQAFMESRP